MRKISVLGSRIFCSVALSACLILGASHAFGFKGTVGLFCQFSDQVELQEGEPRGVVLIPSSSNTDRVRFASCMQTQASREDFASIDPGVTAASRQLDEIHADPDLSSEQRAIIEEYFMFRMVLDNAIQSNLLVEENGEARALDQEGNLLPAFLEDLDRD